MVIMNNTTLTIVSEDGKFGIRNLNGEIIVPCRYDEIIFNEEASCFVCKRDGVFFKDHLDRIAHTGVMDLISDKGKLLIGGIDGYKFLPAHNVLFIHFGSQWEEDVCFKGKYEKRERYAKWVMLDGDMNSVPWKSVCLKGTIIKSLKLPLAPEIAALEYVDKVSFRHALDSLLDLPNIYTFEDYRVLNGNQIYLFPDFLIFTKENYTVECDWAIPLEDNIAVYKSKNEWENIGIATNKFKLPANYSHISKPLNGWCLGVGHMHSIPYEGKEVYGFCELINTQRNEMFHTILFKDLEYEKVENLIKKNILRILEIDEATSNNDSSPNITIPKELYELGIINPTIKEKLKCGASIRDLKKEKIFISREELSRQRKEYLEYLCPHDIHVPDRTSPLDAFEGNGELYNEWLNS